MNINDSIVLTDTRFFFSGQFFFLGKTSYLSHWQWIFLGLFTQNIHKSVLHIDKKNEPWQPASNIGNLSKSKKNAHIAMRED